MRKSTGGEFTADLVTSFTTVIVCLLYPSLAVIRKTNHRSEAVAYTSMFVVCSMFVEPYLLVRFILPKVSFCKST